VLVEEITERPGGSKRYEEFLSRLDKGTGSVGLELLHQKKKNNKTKRREKKKKGRKRKKEKPNFHKEARAWDGHVRVQASLGLETTNPGGLSRLKQNEAGNEWGKGVRIVLVRQSRKKESGGSPPPGHYSGRRQRMTCQRETAWEGGAIVRPNHTVKMGLRSRRGGALQYLMVGEGDKTSARAENERKSASATLSCIRPVFSLALKGGTDTWKRVCSGEKGGGRPNSQSRQCIGSSRENTIVRRSDEVGQKVEP